MYECFHCCTPSVVWDSDFSFEDYGLDGEGIIHHCHCTNCGAEIEYYISVGEDENEGCICQDTPEKSLKTENRASVSGENAPTDLISREAVIEAFSRFYVDMGVDMIGVINKQLVEIIQNDDTPDCSKARIELGALWRNLMAIPIVWGEDK